MYEIYNMKVKPRAFFLELGKKKCKGRRYSSLNGFQDKALSDLERRKKLCAIRREKKKGFGRGGIRIIWVFVVGLRPNIEIRALNRGSKEDGEFGGKKLGIQITRDEEEAIGIWRS
ncbi:hypothetical protein V6N12_044246 [Hibiscus sabdariffa]|uniref:Uncharacterized protein n=1 Tax=Hibiscus sabdariffa TaxID=183260 RepID=A0ABR2DGP3_9ROSI